MNKALWLALLVACGNDGPTKMHTVALADTGFVLDLPEGWSVGPPKLAGGPFDVRGGPPGRAPIIEQEPFAVAAVDEVAARTCESGTNIVKETLPSGGIFVRCRVPSRVAPGELSTSYTAQIAVDAESSIHCFGKLSTDAKAELPITICKSIRRK